ncbi:hypothetical protein CERZMDRAFT_98090 [Cercospora zeae-maydis SCOH1-5]|uniref:Uncharacterized protein n=1 Tax=Cercospora zeae-maydis SCOH1-5 TaxID=717836 RepID=A0A6A6FEK1_9PEZI|nr:hypothetical protein CERZMDRAFT_98090 [Cercospora zeae-maydis SCOH1-5]
MDDSLISHYEDKGSRETSPDPIVLPSSPPSGRKVRSIKKMRRSTPRKSRLSTVSRMTPSKEIVLDTPHIGPNDGSPWRIKVTVHAEQRDTPGKLITRTTSIPLGSPSRSPTKRRKPTPKRKILEAEEGVEGHPPAKKPRARKKKAAPSAEKNRAPPEPQVEQSIEQPAVGEQEDDGFDVFGEAAALEAEQAMQAMESSSRAQTPPNNRRASGRLARLSAQWSNGTGRTQRLSRAREELDEALQDAVGGDVSYFGDLTLSRAEDFTMVSLESLQTAKEASMLHNSHLSRSHLSTVKEGIEAGEKSALSVSYLPSSPPKHAQAARYPDLAKAKARTSILSSWEPSLQRQGSLQSPFEPTSSARKRQRISSPRIESHAENRRATQMRTSTSSRRTAHAKETPQQQWQREREAVSQQIRDANPQNVVTVDDDADISDDDDDNEREDFGPEAQLEMEAEEDHAADLWQTEASRDIGQDSRRGNLAENQMHDSQRSERVEDLFAHIPPKPLRSNIPRTWRRSSGMDFSYVDSPAHLPLAEPTGERRQSTDGSGVLTPPSTDRSSDNVQEEDGTVDLQGEANDQLQSEFTQPETEGTRYQDDNIGMFDDEDGDEMHQNEEMPQDADDESSDADVDHHGTPQSNSNRDGEYAPSRNDSKSPLSEVESPDAADKAITRSAIHSSAQSTRQSRAPDRGIMQGAFPSDVEYQPKRSRRSTSSAHDTSAQHFETTAADTSLQNNMPQHNNAKPRRRPPRRPTADLTELLGLASSPAKPAPQELKVSEVGTPAQHLRQSTPINDQDRSQKAKSGNVEVNGDTHRTEEVNLASTPRLEQPAVPAQNAFISPPKLTHDPITGQLLAQPKRRGRRKKAGDQSLTESSMTDSFASSNNSQQQQQQQGAVVGESTVQSSGDQTNGRPASEDRTALYLAQQSRKPQLSSRDFAQQEPSKQQRNNGDLAETRKGAISTSTTRSDQDQVLQSSAVKRKENYLMRLSTDEEEHAAKRRSIREPSHERPGTGISTREYHAPARTSRRSGDQEQLLRESTTSRTTTITEQRQTKPQRQRFGVAYPTDEGDERDPRPVPANGHHRIMSAVDSNTEVPDDEGTRPPVEEESLDQEDTYGGESTAHTEHLRSYEEDLNLDSPTKIKVKFNDSISFGEHVDQTSSWLADAGRRPALFETSAPPQQSQQPLPRPNFRPVVVERPLGTPEQKRAAHLPGLNIFSKLGSVLWNAVPRSTEPTEIYPEHYKHQEHENSFATTITTHDDSTFTTSLRSQLRSRYGVLSSNHPWTMSHQRTLHRMLNSALSRRHDTLIPSSGPLPKEVFKLVNTTISSITDYKFHFTHQYAYVVWSFFQILVNEGLVEDMKKGEVGFLGDETARRIRGYFDPVRHGDDLVWTLERDAPEKVVRYVEGLAERKEKIEWSFVARALGDCVGSNETLERRSLERSEDENSYY